MGVDLVRPMVNLEHVMQMDDDDVVDNDDEWRCCYEFLTVFVLVYLRLFEIVVRIVIRLEEKDREQLLYRGR